jgi:hypothetical protein
MRYLGIVLLWSILAIPASADSLWRHNGSIVRLYGEGSDRFFQYLQPRKQLRAEGVEIGTTLFRGKLVGEGIYSGTAFRFSRRCGPVGYTVKGALVDDRSLTLRGRLPRRSPDCKVTGYSEDVLVFSLTDGTPPALASTPALVPHSQPTKRRLLNRTVQPRAEKEGTATNPARLPIKVIGCESLETFQRWVQEFGEASAELQPEIIAQGMQIAGCRTIAEGLVRIIESQDLYSCVRPPGENLCYWTLGSVFHLEESRGMRGEQEHRLSRLNANGSKR